MLSQSWKIAGLLSSPLLAVALGCGGRPDAEGSMTEAVPYTQVGFRGEFGRERSA